MHYTADKCSIIYYSKCISVVIALTKVAHTTRTPNAVDVLLNVTGQVKVNDVLYIGDVQTTSSHL